MAIVMGNKQSFKQRRVTDKYGHIWVLSNRTCKWIELLTGKQLHYVWSIPGQ